MVAAAQKVLTAQERAQMAYNANLAIRNAITSQAVPMLQQIYSATFQPATQSIVNIPPQNVGLVKGFLIQISALVTNGSGSTFTLTPQGAANIVQRFQFTDLQNYQRVNTAGWHLSLLNSVKQGRPFLSSTASDSPMGYGSNWTVIKAPATIATGNTGTISMYYWLPLSYTDMDLTGAVYMNVLNATANIQLTLALTAQALVATGTDPSLAVYQSAGNVSASTITNVVITVYQAYYDQLPTNKNGAVLLPQIDVSTIYELKDTAFTGIVASTDFNMAYSNFRHFLSTSLILNNQTAGAYPTAGSDVNYFSFRTANYTDIRKASPFVWAGMARRKLLTDCPLATYYFDTRDRPIYTTQQGNTNLVVNMSTVNANASILVGWEMLANIQNLQNAGALASN